jgi:uncharacterized membrane protein YedE/YeeE
VSLNRVAPFAAGLIFAVGLGLAGMTDPRKVIGFLDVFGRWDASLAFVMAGAIGVHLPFLRLVRRRPLAAGCGDPSGTGPAVDRDVLLGSAVFGVGWGLGGYCPGPAVVSAATGGAQAVVFLMAMLLGVALFALWPRAKSQ